MSNVIFIDRDGVVNKDLWGYVERPEQFEFLPGVLDALKKLSDAEYQIVIISNQAGVGDGKFTKDDLNNVNNYMMKIFKEHTIDIAAVYYCVHGKQEDCECRKPKPGLFEIAEKNIDFDKTNTYFIGDKLSDIQAGKDFGLKTAMVLTGYGAREKDLITTETKPEFIAKDLQEAVERILVS